MTATTTILGLLAAIAFTATLARRRHVPLSLVPIVVIETRLDGIEIAAVGATRAH